MDFKKLLLNKNMPPSRSGKISAVEALKLSKSSLQKAPSPTQSAPNTNSIINKNNNSNNNSSNNVNSSMNILDLSGSPKTFATRRMIRQGQFGSNVVNSPTKPGGKQKHSWRMQNIRTDVISTAIPEAAAIDEEQESSPNAHHQRKPIEIKKSPEIVIKDVTEVEREITEAAAAGKFASSGSSLKENLFIKQEENNFTVNEIREHKKSAHLNLQQQRAQFLFGGGNVAMPVSGSHNNNKTAVFKSNGHYGGIVSTNEQISKDNSSLNALPTSLETAL
jgi:hypothetical protein